MTKKKTLQYFSKEHLEMGRKPTPDEVIEYLENYRNLMLGQKEKCKLISIKVEPLLLDAFKAKAKLLNIPYQTQIKKLMRDWIENH